MVGNDSGHPDQDLSAIPFFHHKVTQTEIELGFGRVGDRSPGRKDSGQSRRKKRPPEHGEDQHQHGKRHRYPKRNPKSLKVDNLRGLDPFRSAFGLVSGGFQERLRGPRCCLGALKLHRGDEKTLKTSVLGFNVQRSLRGIVAPELPPPVLPGLIEGHHQKDHQNHGTRCTRQIGEPVDGHPNKKKRDPPAAHRQQTSDHVLALLASPDGMQARFKRRLLKGVGHGRSCLLRMIHSAPSKPARSRITSQ